MAVFNIQDAKTHLSRLLELVAKSGRPIAKLVRMAVKPRRPGRLKSRIRVGPNFDEPLPGKILAAFRGENE